MKNRIRIYLDQNHWIYLAQAYTNHKSGMQYKGILTYLFKKIQEQKIICPLSSTHYMELAYVKDYRQRKDLAKVMSIFSAFNTLSSKKPVQMAEIEQALNKYFGIPKNPMSVNPLGLGCNFAFTGESQALQLHGSDEELKKLEISLGGREKMEEWKTQKIYYSEMMFLSGPSDELRPILKQKYDYKPEAAMEVALKRASQEQELADMLIENPRLKIKIDDMVNARYLYWELSDSLIKVLEKNGMTMQDFLAMGKEKVTSFLHDIPSANVAVTLSRANFKNLNRVWEKNDMHDLDAVIIAVPYCDIVVTDKYVANQLNRAQIGKVYNTIILSKLNDLPAAIDIKLK